MLAADPFYVSPAFGTICGAIIVTTVGAVIQWRFKISNDRQLVAFQSDQTRQLESYKDSLKRDSDAEVEKLRNKLRLDAFIHETRFQKMHEKQAEYIAGLHDRIQTAIDSLAECAAHQLEKKQPVSQTLLDTTFNHMEDIKLFLNSHQLYFNEGLVKRIDDMWYLMFPIYLRLYERIEVGDDKWNHFATDMKATVQPLLAEIRAEFRKLIGVEDK